MLIRFRLEIFDRSFVLIFCNYLTKILVQMLSPHHSEGELREHS